jgi:V-type H+-transporting ATPase subunit C
MSWFFLATPLGKDKNTSDKSAFTLLQQEALGSGGKQAGDLSFLNIDKSKFKIGTLDQLVKLNDALLKVDHHLETVIKKIQRQAEEISDDITLKVETSDATMDLKDYVQQFQWDDQKYPRSRSLIDIATIVSEKMTSIDSDMKKHIDEYNLLKGQLFTIKKKEEGNYVSKDPGDIVYGKIDKKHFIHDSKFLRNVLIIVPKAKIDYFKHNYENVKEGLVPKSARHLVEAEDKDGNQVFRVVVMENSADSFTIKCKSKMGFAAKIFIYDAEGYQKELEEAKVLEGKLQKLTGKMEKRCYYTFSELYMASMHLKVMRAYIDGVLRFGIPPRFIVTVVHIKSGYEKKMLNSLTDLFADPKMKGMYGTKEEIGDSEDFFPFVSVAISILN